MVQDQSEISGPPGPEPWEDALTPFKESWRKQVSAKGHEIAKIGVDPL